MKRSVEDLTTYRRSDGEPIAGDFKFVTDPEWLDDEVGNWESVAFVKERWVLADRHILTVYPPHMLCTACDGEGEVAPCDEPTDPQDCPRCKGTGEDPLAGQTVESEES